MLVFAFLPFFYAGASSNPAQPRFSFYSGEYGGNSGEHFDQSSNQLDGPITALRVRANDRYILSIQVRYGDSWSSVEGSAVGTASDQQLFLGEGFVQARGRFGSYVEYLAFRTNLGRAISFGPSSGSGTTFEAEPLFPGMVLRSIHGRSGPFINAIGFHWDEEPWIRGGNQSSPSTLPPEIAHI
ncbi:Zymogen granule membrane protein 16 [Varanus komodoensis]|uniref:zymogen granule membrane protein 16-like n=1 Tax=Varanus komodoensis TaxID=61221 RepID=UPI001CF79567|nr:zymogen granule membrane protein 16-like [Varanus komodoensis]KAF7238739.1 Zymogen granule membrane protein 16 [Varanus komodoensis]